MRNNLSEKGQGMMWSEKSPGNCHFVKRKMTKVTNFREPENKEVEKLNRTNLPFSSQIPFKVICPESLNSPLKRKKGKSLSQIIANQEQVLPDRGEGEKKGLGS